jgi:D-alanyl-D-alanine carboxypeptidase/D-alanyl-D-alanine-endopeptidase (penicillin-binding protein 4)
MSFQKSIITGCLLLCSTIAWSQNISNKISQGFENLLSHPDLKHGIASLYVLDSKNNDVVFEKNSQLGLPTASTLKVVTWISALELLGPTYRYETKIGHTGIIDQSGILHGDIIIVGSGDPTLGSDRYAETKADALLKTWIEAMRKKGIKAIQGNIIADDRLYEGYDIPGGWLWTDMGNYYGAGVSALNWKENKAGIQFKPGSIGSSADIARMTADLSYLTVVNQVSTGNRGSGDGVYAYSAPYSNKIYLRGTYGQDLQKTIEISIPDPAYQLAFDLHTELEKTGIIISGKPQTGQSLAEQGQSIPSISALLSQHYSPQLTEIIHWFNQKSINLYGEALVRSIAHSKGKSNTPDGIMIVQQLWTDRLGIYPAELDIMDGSGLSSQNNVNTATIAKIMQYAIGKPWYSDFVKSLPTINQMRMKSGTIGGTLGYTGYHTAKNGQKYTFSILIYNYNGSASAMRRQIFSVLDILR